MHQFLKTNPITRCNDVVSFIDWLNMSNFERKEGGFIRILTAAIGYGGMGRMREG